MRSAGARMPVVPTAGPAAGAAGTPPAASGQRRITVLYIGSVGRSGSTLIERVLATYPGVCSVGELGLLYLVGSFGRTLSTVTCPCGSAVAECAHWSAVRRAARLTDGELEELVRLQRSVFRIRSFFLYYLPVLGRPIRRSIRALATLTERVYRGAAEVADCDVVIDGSNYAVGALMVAQMSTVDLAVLHVVRAPEAVVHSWRGRKHHPAFDTPTSSRRALRVLAGWWLHNLMIEVLRLRIPIRRCRYESFVRAPRSEAARLLSDLLGQPIGQSSAFEDGQTIRFGVSHAILGNPALFAGGVTRIAADDRFMREQSPAMRRLSVLLTLPLRSLYGYPTAWRSWPASSMEERRHEG